jgi:HTH-type transcriptional regulator, competence development regulator
VCLDMPKNVARLGEYLKTGREAKGLTLRAVEEETKISNGYLSQLEGGKIVQPSPVDLNELCELYGLEYTIAMEYAGYPIPKGVSTSTVQQKLLGRLGNITKDDEDALVDYMQFLRAKKRKSK